MLTYLTMLGLTIAIELPIAALLAPGRARGRVTATALFLNLASHPLATLAVAATGGRLAFGAVELLVLAAEAVGYARVAGTRVSRSIAIATIANLLTVAASIALATWWW
jgi:hypothetical protein